MMKRELVRFESLFSPSVSAWVTQSAISDNYYTELYSTIGSSESDFFVRAVILNPKSRLGKSVNYFNSLSSARILSEKLL